MPPDTRLCGGYAAVFQSQNTRESAQRACRRSLKNIYSRTYRKNRRTKAHSRREQKNAQPRRAGAADVLVRQPKYSTCLIIILVYLSLILVAIFHSSMFPLVPIRSSHMSGANTSSARAAGPQGFCGRRPQHCKELYMRRKRTLKVLLDACRGSRDNSIPEPGGTEDRR